MRSGALPVPDLPSPPHPRYPNLTGAQTANLATRYPTHRKQRGGRKRISFSSRIRRSDTRPNKSFLLGQLKKCEQVSRLGFYSAFCWPVPRSFPIVRETDQLGVLSHANQHRIADRAKHPLRGTCITGRTVAAFVGVILERLPFTGVGGLGHSTNSGSCGTGVAARSSKEKASPSSSALRVTRTTPPFANRPNSNSSASGFLMCSWITRARGRAPKSGSYPFSVSHVRALTSSSIL